MYQRQTLGILRYLGESLDLYEHMINDLCCQQTPEDLALTLAALLSRERLLFSNKDDTIHTWNGVSLAGFHAILTDEDISNKRAVFEQTIMSLLRVLPNLRDRIDDIFQHLADVRGQGTSLRSVRGPLDGLMDQYWESRINNGSDHKKAFEDIRELLRKLLEEMPKSDMGADDGMGRSSQIFL